MIINDSGIQFEVHFFHRKKQMTLAICFISMLLLLLDLFVR